MAGRRIRVPNRVIESSAVGLSPGVRESGGGARPIVVEPVSPAPIQHDRMHSDWEYLVAIARRHAAIVLAGPLDERESRLDACRLVWLHYAAAFGAGMAAQARFADELQDVTRVLIKEQQRAERASHHPTDRSLEAAPIITIEELRPLLRQIMRE